MGFVFIVPLFYGFSQVVGYYNFAITVCFANENDDLFSLFSSLKSVVILIILWVLFISDTSLIAK